MFWANQTVRIGDCRCDIEAIGGIDSASCNRMPSGINLLASRSRWFRGLIEKFNQTRRILLLRAGLPNLEISTVSLDQSLKRGSRLVRARNVMKRAERIAKLTDEDRWDESKSVLGIPKTKVPKNTGGRKKKKKEKTEEGEEEKEVK